MDSDNSRSWRATRLEGANRFYPACGFEKAAEIVQHGEVLNVYIAPIATE